MDDLATIAERVWKVCPECRVDCLYHYDGGFGWQLEGESIRDGHAELLIIGACVTACANNPKNPEPQAHRWVKEDGTVLYGVGTGYQYSEYQTSLACAWLLYCEAVAKEDKT